MKWFFPLLFIPLVFAHAKRLGPKPVKPVSDAGLRFEAIPWGFEHNNIKQNGGFIRVVNTRNSFTICIKQVYETKYDKNLEQDVQDNFITDLKIEGNALVIGSEKLPPIRKPIENFCG
jgi:hypothetical protein